jgi:hypothetical protein
VKPADLQTLRLFCIYTAIDQADKCLREHRANRSLENLLCARRWLCTGKANLVDAYAALQHDCKGGAK